MPPQRKRKLAIITNVVAPSRVPLFEALSDEFDTLVLSGRDEANRSWRVSSSARMKIEKVWGLQLRSRKKTGVRGVSDTVFLHLSLGLLWRLPQYAPDIIVTNEMGFRTFISLLYGKIAGIPVWVWWGGTIHSEHYVSRLRSWARPVLARRVKRWITYGQTATAYLQSIGVRRDFILQIQNSIQQETFQQPNTTAIKWFQDEEHPVLVVVGQMIARKGLDRLIEASGRLAAQGHRFTLVLIGRGPERETLERLAADHNVNLVLLEEQSQSALNDIYRSADAMVFPTLEDIWGLVVNEALWAGLPVLCSCYAGSAPELLPHENIFDPLDKASFDTALLRAIEGQLQPADTSPLLTWQSVAATLVTALDTDLIPSPPPRGGATRICIVSHSYIERANLPILASTAAQPSVELALITPEKYMVDLQHSTGVFSTPDKTYRTYPVPIRFGSRQGAFLYQPRALRAALDDFRPDIVLHEQEVFALGAGQLVDIATERDIPLVMQVAENIERSLAWPRRLLRRYVLKHCTALICWSEGSARRHRKWGFRRALTVIPGMAVSALNSSPVFGRRNPAVLEVCFAGRLIRSKGIDCLLGAIALLRDRHIPVRCRIAGHGPDREALEILTRQLNLQDHVQFLGVLAQEDVLRLLRNSDVLALPSRRTRVWEEQFGRVLVQAMAEATVTIGSRTGAIPDVIGSEDLLFEEDNCIQLAGILERFAVDTEFLARHQRALWLRAQGQYLNNILAARKVAFLTQVLQNYRHPAAASQIK